MVGRLCDEEGLDQYLHHFAPTASFKTNVNAKSLTLQQEKEGKYLGAITLKTFLIDVEKSYC